MNGKRAKAAVAHSFSQPSDTFTPSKSQPPPPWREPVYPSTLLSYFPFSSFLFFFTVGCAFFSLLCFFSFFFERKKKEYFIPDRNLEETLRRSTLEKSKQSAESEKKRRRRGGEQLIRGKNNTPFRWHCPRCFQPRVECRFYEARFRQLLTSSNTSIFYSKVNKIKVVVFLWLAFSPSFYPFLLTLLRNSRFPRYFFFCVI